LSAGQRRAIVTGASSGIGEAVARVLASAGYRVALLARRADELERVRMELSADGTEHLALPCDLTDESAIEAAFGKVAQEFGGLDLLVNNAGLGYRARVEELEADMVRRVLDTNVTAVLLTCRAALPLLRSGEKPVVVNVASVVGRRGIPGQAVYSASKAAVCSIGESLRIEWAEEGIAVCTLNPALTATGFFAAQANPAGLSPPDLADAEGAIDVARHVLALDQRPHPERTLRWKWRMLGVLSLLAPRLADRTLARRLGPEWSRPLR
jgi:NAD(P)-dependent dehydrogenase (short-subunit alcohol dehydrogenase family)